MTWDATAYDEMDGDNFAWADPCLRPDKNYEPEPNLYRARQRPRTI